MRLFASVAGLFLLAAAPVTARDLPLAQPIDCTLGETCFIQQFVDHDPGEGARDFTCGPLSYDGHKGTDFGLPSFAAMRAGVAVIAAAPGTVVAFREGVPDTGWDESLTGKECGNGVVVDHGGGWQTQYCHLKEGSIAVEKGQRVAIGTMLGQVGFSGRTEFPHVHLSVRKNGQVVDPFDPDGQITCGAPDDDSLWSAPPAYTPGGLLSAGFSSAVPSYEAVKDGTANEQGLGQSAPALVLWGYAFGGRTGDEIALSMTGPEGEVINHTALVKRNRAQFFRAAGRKAPSGGWPAGTYQGTVSLIRDGALIDSIQTETVLTSQ